jgi:anti-anti-sigma regulatory factor
MAGAMHDRYGETPSRRATARDPATASLLVYLHHQGHRCVASFSGALTAATRSTVDGIANLIAGEESIVLDLSRVAVVDEDGTDALETLVESVLAHGAQLQICEARIVGAQA